VTIPPFDASGNLPQGTHETSWNELVARYQTNQRRRELFTGLRAALMNLREAGCRRVYIDGSFVTSKESPGDYDACWEATGVDPERLDSVLLTFADARAAQKARFGGEFFPAEAAADPHGTRFLDYFQQDKFTGEPKGIIVLDLETLS